MIDLIGNHLAVVPDGRVERAQLSDSNKINNRFLKGIKKMKSPLMFFFNDKRATDERDLLRGMKEIADRDPEDFETIARNFIDTSPYKQRSLTNKLMAMKKFMNLFFVKLPGKKEQEALNS